MLNFFRNNRKTLISSDALRRYLLYATGEVLLVLIGILLALQVNNWNISRQNDRLFEKNVEQLFNSLKTDLYWLEGSLGYTIMQRDFALSIIENPDTFSSKLVAYILFYLDSYAQNFSSETDYLLDNLSFDPGNERQEEIIRQISNYTGSKIWDLSDRNNPYLEKPLIYPIMEFHDIPVPNTFMGLFSLTDDEIDPDFFNQAELAEIQNIIRQEKFRKALRSLSSNKITYMEILENAIEDRNSVLSLIQNSFPDVKLLYDNIGIIGDALPTGWDHSVPMKLVDPHLSI